MIFGVWDDVRGSGAVPKLLMQTAAALIMFYSGVGFEQITIPGIGVVKLGYAAPAMTVSTGRLPSVTATVCSLFPSGVITANSLRKASINRHRKHTGS